MGIRNKSINDISEIENLSVNVKGKFIPLRNLLKIKSKKTWDMINSENSEEHFLVSVILRNRYKEKKNAVREKVMSAISEFDQKRIKMHDVDKEINNNISYQSIF